ncbi:MAG TPA: CDP-diacylglycerol diphosphatase [bacterium]|nr:CDP-diacylglycerol diphosphatase [bacterium]
MPRRRSCAPLAASLLLWFGVGLVAPGPAQSDSNALWNIVHNMCVPNEEEHGSPAPCRLVDLRDGESAGYALLKDLAGPSQFLLIPTARISGIESPALLAPEAPNYFAAAWRAHTYVDRALRKTLPRDDIALAINSVSGRSQNQLHIHIDCVRTDVRAALRQYEGSIADRWAPLGVPLIGHAYLATRVDGEDLDGVNPFQLLADGVSGAREDMGHYTLVVAGAMFSNGRPGFVMLADHANPAAGDRASGEELQDHACAIAK